MFQTSEAVEVVEEEWEERVEEADVDLVPTAVDGRSRRKGRPFETKGADAVAAAAAANRCGGCVARESVVFARMDAAAVFVLLFFFKSRAARADCFFLKASASTSDGFVFFGGVKPVLIRG
jgi:hypothetical protein